MGTWKCPEHGKLENVILDVEEVCIAEYAYPGDTNDFDGSEPVGETDRERYLKDENSLKVISDPRCPECEEVAVWEE